MSEHTTNDRFWNDEEKDWTEEDEARHKQAQWDEFMRQVGNGDHDDLMADLFANNVDYVDLVERIANFGNCVTQSERHSADAMIGKLVRFGLRASILDSVENTRVYDD